MRAKLVRLGGGGGGGGGRTRQVSVAALTNIVTGDSDKLIGLSAGSAYAHGSLKIVGTGAAQLR